MKQLFDKFRNAISGPVEEEPQVRHRTNVLNDVIREGQRETAPREKPAANKLPDSPRVAFIREKNEYVENDDPYNTSDYDRADSWKNGGHR